MTSVTEKLDRIERLRYQGSVGQNENLDAVVRDGINMLNERRALVVQVDAIDPGDFLELVKV